MSEQIPTVKRPCDGGKWDAVITVFPVRNMAIVSLMSFNQSTKALEVSDMPLKFPLPGVWSILRAANATEVVHLPFIRIISASRDGLFQPQTEHHFHIEKHRRELLAAAGISLHVASNVSVSQTRRFFRR